MRRLLISVAIAALTCGQAWAERTVRLADEASILLPDNWLLGADTTTFPVQLVYGNDGAEILIFRSQIDHENMILDDNGLRKSVTQVEKDVIGTLPRGQLLTSTGLYETSRVGFALDFTSFDSAAGTGIRHRLVGYIYRHPDGYQLLFSVWGKSAGAIYSEVEPAIRQAQQSFRYDGPQAETAFPGKSEKSIWMLLLLGMVVVGLFVFFSPRRRRKTAAPPPALDNHFWSCDCGRRNHETQTTCLRCGRTHTPTSAG